MPTCSARRTAQAAAEAPGGVTGEEPGGLQLLHGCLHLHHRLHVGRVERPAHHVRVRQHLPVQAPPRSPTPSSVCRQHLASATLMKAWRRSGNMKLLQAAVQGHQESRGTV